MVTAPRASVQTPSSHGRGPSPDEPPKVRRFADSPKHQKGRPSPRTSPKRLQRRLEFSAAFLIAAVGILHPEPGSKAERRLPLTRIKAVINMLEIPNHLRGQFSILAGKANSDSCRCWMSYGHAAKVSMRKRRQTIDNVAALEAFGFVQTDVKPHPVYGNVPNGYLITLPDALREAVATKAAELKAAGVLVAEQSPPDAADEEPEPDEERAEIAAARDELLARIGAASVPKPVAAPPARPAPAPPPPLLDPPIAAPARANVAPPPLAQDPAKNPDVAGGAILELLLAREDVYRELPVSFERFASRVARIVVRENLPLTQALVGLWECANKEGREGRELADFAVSCIQDVRTLRSPPKPVAAIMARAEKGLTSLARSEASRGPPPS